jgi:hypothetical protein
MLDFFDTYTYMIFKSLYSKQCNAVIHIYQNKMELKNIGMSG